MSLDEHSVLISKLLELTHSFILEGQIFPGGKNKVIFASEYFLTQAKENILGSRTI